MTAPPPATGNGTLFIKSKIVKCKNDKKSKAEMQMQETCWSFGTLPIFLKSTLLSWMPISSWTIACKHILTKSSHQHGCQKYQTITKYPCHDFRNMVFICNTWYVHWLNNGVTGSSLLSSTSSNGEISVRLKSKRPLSCSYISFCKM